MIKATTKAIRKNTATRWFEPDVAVSLLLENQKDQKSLISVEHQISNDGLTKITVVTWKDWYCYHKYFEDPIVVEWKKKKKIYYSENGIVQELISIIEF